MIYFKISIIFIIIFFACSSNLNKSLERKEDVIIINLDNSSINTNDVFLLSSIYKNIRTIILETNELCLIGSLTKLRVYDPYIIILDSDIAKSVLVFDLNGRFLRKIGSIGQGPGEFYHPNDFTVDKNKKEIYVLDGMLCRINKYDLNTGKYLSSIILNKDIRSFNIEYVEGVLFADAYFNKHSDNNYLLRIIQDPSGKIVDHFVNVKEYNKGLSNRSYIHNNVFHLRENGNAVFFQPLMDKIIEITKENVSLFLEIKSKDLITADIIKTAIEKNSMSYMLDLMQYNKYFKISDFIENRNMILFNYQIGSNIRLVMYNKQTNVVRIILKRRDDLFYINSVSRSPAPKVGCFDSLGVYFFYDTSQVSMIQQLASQGSLSPKLDKLEKLIHLEEDANPVIFYYEFIE